MKSPYKPKRKSFPKGYIRDTSNDEVIYLPCKKDVDPIWPKSKIKGWGNSKTKKYQVSNDDFRKASLSSPLSM